MTSDVMKAVLTRFNRKLLLEQRKVVLILDNATCHRKSIIDSFSQIKIIFLLKNTTSRLQRLDAGITQNLKVKYRKTLVKYVLARTNEYSSAMQLIKDKHTDGHSMGSRSMERSKGTTIKNCFEKCGIIENDDLMEIGEKDLEFEVLCSATKYINFKPLSFTDR